MDQVADGGQELVEPTSQLRGFVVPAHLQILRQIPLTLGDALQTAGYAANRSHNQASKAGPDQRKNERQHPGNQGNQPSELGRRTHDLFVLDQANEAPAQSLGRPNVGHVTLAIQFNFNHAFACLRQLFVAFADFRQVFEVVPRLLRVDQYLAVALDEHQIATFAEFDLLDNFSELLE
ncbi:hypothetical protein D3C75_592760 [compost metagenome]